MTKKLKHPSKIKEMVLNEIEREVHAILSKHLMSSMLLSQKYPSDAADDQLKAMKSICLEIREEIANLDRKSAYKTDLDTLSCMDALAALVKSETEKAKSDEISATKR